MLFGPPPCAAQKVRTALHSRHHGYHATAMCSRRHMSIYVHMPWRVVVCRACRYAVLPRHSPRVECALRQSCMRVLGHDHAVHTPAYHVPFHCFSCFRERYERVVGPCCSDVSLHGGCRSSAMRFVVVVCRMLDGYSVLAGLSCVVPCPVLTVLPCAPWSPCRMGYVQYEWLCLRSCGGCVEANREGLMCVVNVPGIDCVGPARAVAAAAGLCSVV